MSDLMVRTGIDARGFKRGLYTMEKDLGDADRRMSNRYGGDMGGSFGSRFWGVGKGAGRLGKSLFGISPGLGVAGAVVGAIKMSYDMIEKYEQKLPEAARKTTEVSRAWEHLNANIARGSREFLPDFMRGVIEIATVASDRASSRLGALFGILGGGTAGPGQIDDFLKDVEYKTMREGSKVGRDAATERAAIDLARLSGDTLTADLGEIDIWRREAVAKLASEKDSLMLTPEEYRSRREYIDAIDMMKRSEANAKWDREQKERSDAAQKARDDQAEKKRKENDEARKAADEVTRKREDAQVDIYESQARFRNAKATTDEEKKSAEEARAYARYKREELDIKRRGLDVDQQNTLELFNQAEYEATIEAIRARQNDKPAPRLQAPDGLDLSSAGAFASQGQAMAFQIPGKIDRTNALLQQANQTLREIKQGQDGTARFAP